METGISMSFSKSVLTIFACLLFGSFALAQQVTLPLPRLLTMMPMGGQAGQSIEVTITGDYLEEVTELSFSSPKIIAKPVSNALNKFTVTIADDAPVGVYDARVLSRLGVSSVRAFSVNMLSEVVRTKPNNSLSAAMPLEIGSICNATTSKRSIDYYSFQGVKDQPVAIDCAAVGIDSRLKPVLILADAKGSDLKVNRTGGMIDFTPPSNEVFIIKVSDLTYQGGERHFYRLALQKGPAKPQPQTQTVSAMSWPPTDLSELASSAEVEPNNKEAQKIVVPCDISGSFYPAADVDTYEFSAKKGDVWWVEIGSERLGLNTDPFVLVQQVKDGSFTDVAELYDIASPLKVTSNGYSYDGPPYDAGSRDVLGKFEVKEDGVYRLQVRDLFGGTRSDPRNAYRLIVRQAKPDFSLAAWALHMTLRNGDRSAFSKPLALRQGDARILEVVAHRRDGFDGEIEITMDNLPKGVRAAGLKIAKGKNVGHLIITAEENASRNFSLASITGKAFIDGKEVTRPVRLASMEWPVADAKTMGEIPAPRLVADIPVSVTDSEQAPLSITLAEDKVFEVNAGEPLKIPLHLAWRNEFNGTSIKVKAYGEGFSSLKDFEIPIKADKHEAVIDLAALKIAPGDYTFAFQSLGICRYCYNPAAVALAEAEQLNAEAALAASTAKAKGVAAEDVETAKKAAEKLKQAEAAMNAAVSKTKSTTAAAKPKDIVDIIISQPIRVSVKPASSKTAAK